MIQFFLVLVALCFGCVVAQHFIPPMPFLEGARVFLMPLVMFYGALALPYGVMLFLALICGIMWDALTVQIINLGSDIAAVSAAQAAGTPLDPASSQTVQIALGTSAVLYALLCSVMSGFRPMYQRGRWEVHCLMSGVLTSFIVLAEFLMLSVRRVAMDGSALVFPQELWWRVGGAGIVAIILAPIAFWILSNIANLVGYNPRQKTEEEAYGKN